jgi:hypothetical protein
MAEKNVVNSLFGLTPELYQQNRLAELQARQVQAGTMAAGPGSMMNPSLAPLYARAAQQGQLIGEGARAIGSLLGVEDPQMQLVTRTNQLVQQIGVDTPEKLQTLAAELQKIPGGAPLAVQAIDKANQMMKTGAEAQTAKQKIDQEKLLREELAKLGDNPTDEQYLNVFRKFGTPDQQARAIEMNIARKERLAAKQPEKLTPEQVAAKKEDAQIAVDTVTEANKLVSNWSTGYGSLLSALPMSDARKLQGKLDTIKSNLAAAMIEDLKSQSRTGATGLGALNREELKVLQTSKASLDAGMGADELKKSLQVIDKYFRRRAGIAQVQEEKPGDKNKSTGTGEWSIVPDGKIVSGSEKAVQVPK